ncbi:hypothetical protein GQ457_03G027180 [Hibiscus cannabinus]
MSDPSIADNLNLLGKNSLCDSVWKAPLRLFKTKCRWCVVEKWFVGAVGGILRNGEGHFLGTFSESVGQGTLVLTELLALSYGLGFFFRSKWATNSRLMLESDSSLAVDWVLYLERCPSMFASLAQTVREVIDKYHVILRHIPRGCNVEVDALAKAGWKWSSNRSFIVRLAYDARYSQVESDDDKIWRCIAMLKGIPQVHMFLWLISKERVLTNVERVRHHMATRGSCGVCNAPLESIDHLFRWCNPTISTWSILVRLKRL